MSNKSRSFISVMAASAIIAVFSLAAVGAAAAPGASQGPAADTPGHAQALSQCAGSQGAFPETTDNAPGNSADQKGAQVAANQKAAHSNDRACTVGALPRNNSGKQDK